MLDQPANRATQWPNEHAGGWTPERISELTNLWNDGFSAGEIALRLGGGVTRNAVIGKVKRLSLSARPTLVSRPSIKAHGNKGRPKANAIVARAERRKSEVARKPKAETLPAELPVEDDSPIGVDVTGLIGILQLTEHTCKWPIGDPKDKRFGFCGAHSEEGKPYCAEHAARAYQGFTPGYSAGKRK